MEPDKLRACSTEIYKPQLNFVYIGMQSASLLWKVISAHIVKESCHCELREDTQGSGSNLFFFLFLFFSTIALLSFALLSLMIDANSILSKDPVLHHFTPIFLKSNHHHPSTLIYVFLFFFSLLLLCLPVKSGYTTPLILSPNTSCRCMVNFTTRSLYRPSPSD